MLDLLCWQWFWYQWNRRDPNNPGDMEIVDYMSRHYPPGVTLHSDDVLLTKLSRRLQVPAVRLRAVGALLQRDVVGGAGGSRRGEVLRADQQAPRRVRQLAQLQELRLEQQRYRPEEGRRGGARR